MSLDLSNNKVNLYICKEIAMICHSTRSLSELILDSTQIPISGIAYIFQVLIDESVPEDMTDIAKREKQFEKGLTNNMESLDNELLEEIHASDSMSLLKDETRSINNPHRQLMMNYNNMFGHANNARQTKVNEQSSPSLNVLSLKDNKIDFRGIRRLKKKLLFNV